MDKNITATILFFLLLFYLYIYLFCGRASENIGRASNNLNYWPNTSHLEKMIKNETRVAEAF